MFDIDKSTVDYLRKRYPEGTRVEMVRVDDPYTKVKSGTQGTVMFVDSVGTIHVKWDDGSTLGLVHNVDKFRYIGKSKHKEVE